MGWSSKIGRSNLQTSVLPPRSHAKLLRRRSFEASPLFKVGKEVDFFNHLGEVQVSWRIIPVDVSS